MRFKQDISAYHFDFTLAYIGKPEFVGNTIIVPLEKFGVIEGYQESENYVFYKSCKLVYRGVTSSVINVTEYTSPNGRGFKTPYKLEDVPFKEIAGDVALFGLEGVSRDLNAWIDWEIIAVSVFIEDMVIWPSNGPAPIQ